MQILANYINGDFLPPKSKQYMDVFNPALGTPYAKLPDSDEEDVNDAVVAAIQAKKKWAETPNEKRAQILENIANLLEKNIEKFALAETNDNGKPLWLAKSVDIPRAIANFRFFASAITHFASESHNSQEMINYTLRKPVGLVGCISPWNLPLYLFTWKIAPALAAGNCVIGKPSEITPLTAYMLCEICNEAGLPPGVLNIVHGYGSKVGTAITAHPQIAAISFTGGTETGKSVAKIASPMFKKVSLELGGKNPNIIFADCNFDKMLGETIRSSFANQGQICLCGSRVFVEESIFDHFINKLIPKVQELTVGDPLLPETKQGAVVSQAHLQKILSCINLAKEEGGKILCGGQRKIVEGKCKEGWFVEPTVITNLSHNCRTNQEEIFGPVISVIPFQSENEVLEWANSTSYGLAASVWTENLSRAHRFGRDLESGIIWVNCWLQRDLRTPFGGMKNSGVGREGGWDALRFCTEAKNICIYHG